MLIKRVLAAAAVLVVAFGATGAQASIITSVWEGTLGSNSGDNFGNSLSGVSVKMTFTYDSDVVASSYSYDYGYYLDFYNYSTPGFFSSATVELGNGASYTLQTPNSQASILLGDASHYYQDIYYNYGTDSTNAAMGAYYYNHTTTQTTLDPAQTFTRTGGNPYDNFQMWFNFTSGDFYYYGQSLGGNEYGSNGGTFSSLVVSGDVPAPASLALLSLGLLGLGSIRRRKTA